MTNKSFYEDFKFLESQERKNFKVKDNKIYYYYYSFIVTFFFLIILGSFIFYYLKQSFDQPLLYDSSNLVVWSPIFAITYVIYYYIFQANIVLDFEKNTINYRICLFTYKIIKTDDIKFICNNCQIGQEQTSKSGKINDKPIRVNPRTNQYQLYYLSIFLKNGELINLIRLGMFMDDYQDSIYLAKKIIKYWNIPLVTCSDYETFSVYQERDSYFLKAKEITKIESDSENKPVVITILFFIFIFILFFLKALSQNY